MMENDELASLAENIKTNGLQNDLIIFENELLDGRNRLKACEMAGVKPRFKDYQGDSPVAFVISQNVQRRHLTVSQRAAVGVEAEQLLEEEAARRQKAQGEHGKESGRGKAKTLEANLPQGLRGPQSRDIAAKNVGVSGKQIQEAKAIKKKSPEKFEAIKRGDLTVHKAKRELDKEEKSARKQQQPG